MRKLLLFFLLLQTLVAPAQRGILYVKKKGYKKVTSFAEGATIKFKTHDKHTVHGVIALIKGDSLRINGNWHRSSEIARIILRDKKGIAGPLLLTTAGVALSTAGMSLAKWNTTHDAIIASSVIGYGNFLVRYLPKGLKRKQYRIGRRFSVQTLDLRF